MSINFGRCHCRGVEFGTFTNQVLMKYNNSLDDKLVSIDTCIATEIGYLWHNGVKTLNSCCGHGKGEPSVIVDDDKNSWEIMEKLGYKYQIAPSGYRWYFLKTKRGFDESESTT